MRLKNIFQKMQINKLIHLKRSTGEFPSRLLVKSCLWQSCWSASELHKALAVV